MPYAFDGTKVPARLPTQACGGTPVWDNESGYTYRCDTCFATIGSMGQPSRCVEINAHDADTVLAYLEGAASET